ncbi:MAG TPA: hypothetical protein VFG04_05835 [Planctomycetaceae bacterium]|nr:hypothetical protein [Planctomycetaceae bacterium]
MRFLFVDADHPSTWPQGLEPIAAGELRKLLAGGNASEAMHATVQIEHAIYHATLRDGVLTDGRAELTLGSGPRPAIVPLEHPGSEPSRLVNFSHVRWQEASRDDVIAKEKVLCGIDRSGCRVVIAEAGRSHLGCDWSLKGRSSSGATEFALGLPPAVVSQIFLQIPAELSVECDQGVLVRGPKDPNGRNALWQLELGSRSTCRLRVLASAVPGTQRVCYDQDTTCVVAADRLRLQSKLQLEVFGAPLRTLRLTVPTGLHLETISYGDDFPLSIPASSSDKAREVSLDLPERLLGKGRTITVEGSAATHANQLSILPQVDLAGAVRREAQVQLTIRAPLKLVRFGGEAAFAQAEAPAYSIDGEETFFLRQNAGDPPFKIEFAEPAAVLAERTQARLDLRRDRCLLAADVVCTASRGSTFSVTFDLPEAWDVTRIEAVGDASRIIDETTRPVAEHRKRVKIDFFRAVTDREAKRFRIEASRALPQSGEAIAVPVIEFPGFASQEVETLVVHGTSIELNLSPAQAFAAFDPTAILSALPDSPLRPDRSAAGETQMLVHRWTAQTPKAQITLRRAEEVAAARVRTSIEIGGLQEISERVDAAIVPASAIDHVLLYLSTKGSPFSWLLANRAIQSTRLPAARHAEWNLPEGGELWDIRLPEPCSSEFHLAGTRRTTSIGGARIPLAFVPIARTFDGTADLHVEDAAQFKIESREAHVVSTPSSDRGVRTFHYNRPADVLVTRPRSASTSNSGTRFVSLRLTSFLNAGGVDDFHRAEFSLTPESAPQPFRFRLASDARLSSVSVNGQLVRVQRRDEDVTVPALPADTSNRIQVEYKTTAMPRLFRENRAIAVPQAQAENLEFHWQVLLAPGLQPSGLPSGLRFDQPLPTLSWAERLFGPLGRSAAQMRISSFKPDAWIVDLAGVDPESETWSPQDRERPPAGWSKWEASAEAFSGDVGLAIWHEGKFRALAWIVCLGCLIGGLAAARFASRAAFRLGPLAVAGGAAFALAAPSPYAMLGGACVSGVVLAFLASRPWKTVTAPAAPTEKGAPRQGSTVSFELRSLGVMLALATFGALAAIAQEPSPSESKPRRVPPNPATTDGHRPTTASDNDLMVVIPVHPGRLPGAHSAVVPGDSELVYLSSAALETLRRLPGANCQNEGTVLLSSDYTIALDERQPATINATYRVAVLPGQTRFLLLRLGNVTLAGANACQVDGQPYPIRKDTEGFVLSLDPSVASQSAAGERSSSESAGRRPPIAAERPSSATNSSSPRPNAVAATKQPRVYEIHLTCFPNGDAKPGQFEIRVPETARTLLRVEKSGPWPVVAIEAGGSKARQMRPGDASSDVGQVKRIQIKAGPSPAETIETPIAAQAVQFLRVTPGLVEMDCRVTYDCANGVPEKFTWFVPAGASIRTPGDTYRAALRPENGLTNTTANGTRGARGNAANELVPLDFDCSGAPSGSLTLVATLLLPIAPSQSTLGAPAYNVRLPRFNGGNGDPSGITITSNQVGISAPPGLRVIAVTAEPNLSRTTKADPTFRQESFGTRKEPDLIFDCQDISVLPLQLAAALPTHKVRLMTHEAHISSDHIQWKTTAEIRTENAPAFVHVLHVDHRLKVDSVSVREDGVERLVRFSQSDDEVTVFLRDRAAATQDLVLTGHMPLDAGRATKLPNVSLTHAVVSEARLAISHDTDVDIAVSDTPGVVRLNKGRMAAPQHPGDVGATANVLEYALSNDPAVANSAPTPEVRVIRRPEPARLGGAPAAMATKNSRLPVVAPQRSTKMTLPAPQTPEAAVGESAKQKPRVDAVATLEIRRDRSVVGSTHVLLEQFVEPSLRLLWPESTVLRGALLDGRPVQPTVSDGWISFAIPSEPLQHRIALHWETRNGSSLTALAHIREALPVPIDGWVKSVLISVAVPPGFRTWAPAHFSAVDPPTFDRLCDAIRSPDPGSTIEENRGTTKPGPGETSADAHLLGRLDVDPSGASLSTWTVDTFWLRVPLAAAIFALIAIAAAHPYAARLGAWARGHGPLTLAVVGLAWWYCLAPRAVGPLLLVIALGLLIVQLRRRPSASARAVPSTLQFPTGLDVR